MQDSYSERYKEAGVDITAGYAAVEGMKPLIARTFDKGVLGGLGGFSGVYQPDLTGMHTPVLVSGTDGVGTKLKIAFAMQKHDTIGQDCVAMCANDVVCAGARPLFFLDYLALGKNVPEQTVSIVQGVTDGCLAAGCALIGGETAEMPGFYPDGEYDLAGFCVGIADKDKLVPSAARPGDILIGVSSSGVHSNGFSLIRKLIAGGTDTLDTPIAAFGRTLGEELLTPTRIYVKAVLSLLNAVTPHGIAHITGGGFYENIPRMLADGTHAVLERAALPVPLVFDYLARLGNLDERECYNVFNMGVGLAVAVAPEDADRALDAFSAFFPAAVIGVCTEGARGITFS